MIPDGITITELAEKLNVTKRTIRYHLQQIGGGNRKNQSGLIIITPEEQDVLTLRIKGTEIKENFSNEIDEKNERIQKLNEAIAYLKKMLEEQAMKLQLSEQEKIRHADLLEEKDRYIQSLNEQIEFLRSQLQTQTQILDQEQQLHLHTKQELETIKNEHQNLLIESEDKKKSNWFSRLFLP